MEAVNKKTFDRLLKRFNQLSSQLYFCLIVQNCPIIKPHTLDSIIIQLIESIQEKNNCSKNSYALIIDNKVCLKFCNIEKFKNDFQEVKISPSCGTSRLHNNQLDGSYQLAYSFLWKSTERILLNINVDQSNHPEQTSSEFKTKIKNNFSVDVYELNLNGIEDFKNIAKSLEKQMEFKKIKEPYELIHSFNRQNRRTLELTGYVKYFPKDDTIFNQEFLVKFNENSILELKKKLINSKDVEIEIEIENVPFSEGNEVHCFRGKIKNHNKKEDKVFKLSKYKELNIEDNYWTQMIARFLAKEYEKYGKLFLVSTNRSIYSIYY